jgi:hypothetical protein
MADFTSVLPEGLLGRAFKAGNGELAWSRDDAIDAITIIEREGFNVLGVDIWIPTSRGPLIPTPFVYDWSSDDWSKNAKSSKTATEFVRNFEWDDSDKNFKEREPYFNLTAE